MYANITQEQIEHNYIANCARGNIAKMTKQQFADMKQTLTEMGLDFHESKNWLNKSIIAVGEFRKRNTSQSSEKD
jgi:hypothetical protein